MSPPLASSDVRPARPDAASRLAALTGWPAGPPVQPSRSVVASLDALVADVARWSARLGRQLDLDWGTLVCGRADLLGLSRQGRRSANGSCRLLHAADGWLAVNLPREDDREAVGALVGALVGEVVGERCSGPWEALERIVRGLAAGDVVATGRLLGMPMAPVPAQRPAAAGCGSGARGAAGGWSEVGVWDPASSLVRLDGVRVVDFSAMWAGPLAARILAEVGATVVKVESAGRADAARGTPAFYRWLHPAGQQEIAVDFTTEAGRRQLRSLVEAADVVIESSRPRAFEQLGIGPRQVAPRRGRVWLSITGYGREAPGRDWVAFGDDAAAAGGLLAWQVDGTPLFLGDAMADPVTGLVGASAVLRSLANGGGALLDVAMSRCAASIATGVPGP